MTELILGTAQFGTAYGITNAAGRIDDDLVTGILRVAASHGIDIFDTSPGYGDAQQRLGSLAVETSPRYVSKFALPDDAATLPSAAELSDATLESLRVDSLYGMLFHRVDDLRDPRADDAWRLLREARDAGAITRIGASVYDAADLAVALERFPDLDLLQIPGSIVDRRLLDSALVAEVHERGVEIHVRSAYLQGLLLAEPAALPVHAAPLAPVIDSLHGEAARQQTTVIALALGYLRDHPLVDGVLVGATNPAELEATAAAWAAPVDTTGVANPGLDERVLDPRRWPSERRA
jgi:aryl-alcohol dehydrogenase-like predicted oxidoreductase